MTAALEVRDFGFWYGRTQALKQISLAMAPGRITAFIGPSGCGKSNSVPCSYINESSTVTR